MPEAVGGGVCVTCGEPARRRWCVRCLVAMAPTVRAHVDHLRRLMAQVVTPEPIRPHTLASWLAGASWAEIEDLLAAIDAELDRRGRRDDLT